MEPLGALGSLWEFSFSKLVEVLGLAVGLHAAAACVLSNPWEPLGASGSLAPKNSWSFWKLLGTLGSQWELLKPQGPPHLVIYDVL